MHQNSTNKRTNDLAALLFAALVVAFTITLLRYLAAAWKPIYSIDLAIYWSGLRLFFSPANPYDPHAMLLEQQKLSTSASGVMVWNPPILFLMLCPFLSLPIYVARVAWSFLTTICTVLNAYFSARLVSDHPLKFPVWILFSVLFCPLIFEITVEQISSYLTLFFILSFLLFKRGYYGSAGVLAGMLIVKPHMFYLMLLWFFLVSLFEKRWLFFLGFILSILVGSGLAEIFHPGINMQWLMRESWPTQYEGSTLPALVKTALSACCNIRSDLPQIIIPGLTAVWLILSLLRHQDSANRGKIMIIAIILCPLTAPYGFVFDQVVLIVPIVAILACLYEENFPARFRLLVVMVLALLQAAIAGRPNIQIFGVILSWFALPLIVLIIWRMLTFHPTALRLKVGQDA